MLRQSNYDPEFDISELIDRIRLSAKAPAYHSNWIRYCLDGVISAAPHYAWVINPEDARWIMEQLDGS